MTEEHLFQLCGIYKTTDVHIARACYEFGVKVDELTKDQKWLGKIMNHSVLFSTLTPPDLESI